MAQAQYQPLIDAAASQYGIPADLLGRLLRQESGFRPEVISGQRVSSAGAQGIAQFMPATARELGVNPLDPESAIPGAARYLSQLQKQFGGDMRSAVAAYNAGPGRVASVGGDFSRLPAETRAYLAAVLPGQGGTQMAAAPAAPAPAPGAPAPSPAGPAVPMNISPEASGLLAGAAPGLLGRQQQQAGLNMAAQGLLAMNARPAPIEAPPLPQPYRPRVDMSRLQAMLRQA